ncbi:MAG: inovirus-type Gp2 protein [Pseudomonadota bacterium]|nr:inovirus-type Gp2 protein [Pseudomonadota bacterium]
MNAKELSKNPIQPLPKFTSYTGDSKDYRNGRLTHIQFKDMKLTYSEHHNGYRIMTEKGPVNVQHLESLIETVVTTYLHWNRTFSTRVDLYYPSDWSDEKRLSTDYFAKFIRSINEQMIALNKGLTVKGNHRDLTVRCFRTIEVGKDRGVHIHCLLMFNGHQFRGLGDFGEPHVEALDDNGKPLPEEKRPLNNKILQDDWLARKILAAWASALFGYDRRPVVGLGSDDWRSHTRNSRNIEQVFNLGLVHFSSQWVPSKSKDPVQRRSRRDKQIKSLIYRSSYLCKAVSKQKLEVSSKRYIKVAQGSSIKRNDRGVQKAKRLHRYQISWPLYQSEQGFECLWGSDVNGWQPDLEVGEYIQPHLESVLKSVIDYQHRVANFTLLDFKLNLKGKPHQRAINELVIKRFVKEFKRQLKLYFYQDWNLTVPYRHNSIFEACGLQKEIVEDGQRKLHVCLLLDTRLWQKIHDHPQLQIEQLLLGSAVFTLEGLISPSQSTDNNLQIFHFDHFERGKHASEQQFEKILDSFSRLALSDNTLAEYEVHH